MKAKQRDFIPTVGISSSAATLNQLCLYWGIIPVPGLLHDSQDQVRDAVIAWGRQDGCLANGDRIVLVTGTGLAPLAHNMVHVHEVSE